MNITPMQRLGLWLAWLLISLLAFAPAGRAETQTDTPIWLQADTTWNAWSGTPRQELAPELAKIMNAPEEALHDRLLQELDQTWLLYMSDRNLDAATERYGAIWTRAFSAASYPVLVKTGVYAELHLMRYRLLIEYGNAAALRSEPALCPTAGVIGQYVSIQSITRSAMTGQLIPGYTAAGLLERAEATPEMIALRAEWSAQDSMNSGFDEMDAYIEARYGLVGQEVRSKMTDLVLGREYMQIPSLGRGAIGVLASMVIVATGAEDAIGLPEDLTAYDVIRAYLLADPAGALELFVDWYPRANQKWRWALANVALRDLKPDWVEGTTQGGDQTMSPWKLLVDPRHAELAELLVSDPERVSEGLLLTAPLALQNQIHGELAASLGEWLAGSDRSLAGKVLQALETRYMVPGLIPIFERGVASPFADVRAMCGARLLDMGAVAEVRALATHADSRLRTLAIAAMGPVEVIRLDQDRQQTSRLARQPASAKDVARLAGLLKSDLRSEMLAKLDEVDFALGTEDVLIHAEDLALRKCGIYALADLPAAEIAKWIPQLLNDPDPAFRRALIPIKPRSFWLPEWDLVSLRAIIVGLAGDADSSVRAAVDAMLTNPESYMNALNFSEWADIVQGVLPAREAYTQASPFASPDGRSNWHLLPKTWFVDYADAPFLLEFAIDRGLGELVLAMMGTIQQAGQSKADVVATLMQLDPADRRALYNLKFEPWMVAELSTEWSTARALMADMFAGKVPDIEAVRLEFEATTTPADWAVNSVFKGRDEAARELWRSILDRKPLALNLRLQAGRALQVYNASTAERYLLDAWSEAVALQGSARAEALGLFNSWLNFTDAGQWVRRLDLAALSAQERSNLYLVVLTFPEGQDLELLLNILRDLLNAEATGVQGYECVGAVLEQLKSYSLDAAGRALIIQAASVERYAVTALEVMVEMPHPDYLETAQASFQGAGSIDRLVLATRIMMSIPDLSSLPILEGWRAPDGLTGLRANAIVKIKSVCLPKAESLPSKTEAVAELLSMLKASDAYSRATAARSLARMGALEALPVLIAAIAKEADADVKTKMQAAVEELLESGAK